MSDPRRSLPANVQDVRNAAWAVTFLVWSVLLFLEGRSTTTVFGVFLLLVGLLCLGNIGARPMRESWKHE